MLHVLVAGVIGLAGIGWGQPATTQPATTPKTAQPIRTEEAKPEAKPAVEPVTMGSQLGFVIQKGTEGQSLTTVSEGKSFAIVDGETTIENSKLNKAGLSQNLKIDRVSLGTETVLVKVVVTPSKRSAAFVDAMEGADAKGAPVLVDTKGVKYSAVGFVHRDSKATKVRFTQGTPLSKMGDAPSVTRNTPDRELTLLFVVNEGVELKEFRVGKGVIEDWSEKPKKVERRPGK